MNPLVEKLLAEIQKLPPEEQEIIRARLSKEQETESSDKKSTYAVDISWRI